MTIGEKITNKTLVLIGLLIGSILLLSLVINAAESQEFTHISASDNENEETSNNNSLTTLIPGPNKLIPVESPADAEIKVVVGNSEGRITLPGKISAFVPDGGISKLENPDGQIKMIVPTRKGSYLLEGDSLDDLKPASENVVLGPDSLQYDLGVNGYTAIHSIISRDEENKELIGFYHAEYWKDVNRGYPFVALVGLAVSHDGGLNWQKIGPIISGMNLTNANESAFQVSGAGQPSAIIAGDYIYLYYTDWNGEIRDAIHVARAPLTQTHDLNSWKKLYKGTFGSSGLGGKSTPLIYSESEESYTALPGVKYLEQFELYSMTFETNSGFWITFSKDGLNWQIPYKIANFPQLHSERGSLYTNKEEVTWYSYPTLIEEDGQYWLYYSVSHGKYWDPYTMVRRPIEITR
jgi:hypothetical protein